MLWHWITVIIIGAVCGWLAGALMGGKSKGILMNIILGIIGGVVGRFIFSKLGLGPTNWFGSIISGVAGTCILIAVGRFLTKK